MEKRHLRSRKNNLMRKTLVVAGGGAAGFFCAVTAARLNPQLKVTLVEKTNKLLSKVKVSGGGRCNVTHACFSIADMIKKYPRGAAFLKKAFHHFFTTDTIEWFKQRGVLLKTEADGRMFPVTDSSQTIIDCLIKAATAANVRLFTRKGVEVVRKRGDGFELQFTSGPAIPCDRVLLATGGTRSASGAQIARWLGHSA